MSTTEMLQLKQQLSRITDKERREVTAFLHRLKQNSPAWQKEMSKRMSEMDAGKKFKLPTTRARA
ncbi:MAG: hypothetical protein V4662_16015 [Verrucomicrobiota bacterium]